MNFLFSCLACLQPRRHAITDDSDFLWNNSAPIQKIINDSLRLLQKMLSSFFQVNIVLNINKIIDWDVEEKEKEEANGMYNTNIESDVSLAASKSKIIAIKINFQYSAYYFLEFLNRIKLRKKIYQKTVKFLIATNSII